MIDLIEKLKNHFGKEGFGAGDAVGYLCSIDSQLTYDSSQCQSERDLRYFYTGVLMTLLNQHLPSGVLEIQIADTNLFFLRFKD